MKAGLKWVLLLSVSSMLVLVVSASATNTPARRLMHASGPITTLAIDGPRVVYSTDGNGVYVWNVRSGASSLLRRPSKSDVPLIQEVAIAGQRLAWITRSASGNSEETFEHLYTASLTRKGSRELGKAYRIHEFAPTGLPQLWDGDWIIGLVGSGNTLAVSRWTETPLADWSGTTITNASLSLIGTSSGLHPIVVGEQAIVSRAADAGQVAVQRADGSVGLYSSRGALLRTITPSSVEQIAMGGGRLVVLTKSKALEVYSTQTGTLQHRWPIKTRNAHLQVGHLQAYGRIALFSVDPRYLSRNVSMLDLKTGKCLTLAWRWRSGSNDASVGPLGVVYAVNSYKAYGGHHPSGTLVFLSTARVLTGIAKGHL